MSSRPKASSRRPTSLSVMGVPFQIKWGRDSTPTPDLDAFGETSWENRTIHIFPERCPDEAQVESTLLHELLHAIVGIAGHDKRISDEEEERLVSCFEHALYPLMVQLVAHGYFKGGKK